MSLRFARKFKASVAVAAIATFALSLLPLTHQRLDGEGIEPVSEKAYPRPYLFEGSGDENVSAGREGTVLRFPQHVRCSQAREELCSQAREGQEPISHPVPVRISELVGKVSFAIPLALSTVTRLPTQTATAAKNFCNNPNFVPIPGGEFIRGSDRAQRDFAYRISAAAVARGDTARQARAEQNLRARRWFENESPRQRDSLPDYCLGKNLVTNAEYQAFVKATGHRAPGITEAEYQRQGFLVHPYRDVVPYLWQGQNFPQGRGNHPVVLVSYPDAIAFARWKSQQDGVTYRLPTAREWEKAARGTDGRYFPWGSTWQAGATNWGQTQPQGTSAVGRFPASRGPLGGEDLSGNVFEYTGVLASSVLVPNESPLSPASNNAATGDRPTARLIAQSASDRVLLKGCSWDDLPGFCRAAYQHLRPQNSRHILFGFRLAFAPEKRN